MGDLHDDEFREKRDDTSLRVYYDTPPDASTVNSQSTRKPGCRLRTAPSGSAHGARTARATQVQYVTTACSASMNCLRCPSWQVVWFHRRRQAGRRLRRIARRCRRLLPARVTSSWTIFRITTPTTSTIGSRNTHAGRSSAQACLVAQPDRECLLHLRQTGALRAPFAPKDDLRDKTYAYLNWSNQSAKPLSDSQMQSPAQNPALTSDGRH